MVLRSGASSVIFAKVLGTAFFAGSGLLIVGSDFPNRRLFLAFPFFVGSLFAASLAVVESRDGVLRYKRLFKWTTISENEILNARVEWAPIIGSLRFKSFLIPWGRLYFVLDGNVEANPFHEGVYPLLRSIQDKSLLRTQTTAKEIPAQSEPNRLKIFRAMGFAVAGVLASAWTKTLNPNSRSPRSLYLSYPHEPTVVRIQWELAHLLQNSEVVVILFLIFSFLALRRYRHSDAWIFAFLAGFSLPYVLSDWL